MHSFFTNEIIIFVGGLTATRRCKSSRVRQQVGRGGLHGRGRDHAGSAASRDQDAPVEDIAVQRDDGREPEGRAGVGRRGRKGAAVLVLRFYDDGGNSLQSTTAIGPVGTC